MRNILMLAFLSALLVSCSEKDNYPAPDEIIKGAIIDEETGDSIPSQQPNGLRIRMYDLQYAERQPNNFYGKQDGSFENKFFPGKYKLIADNGAFYPMDTMNVELPLEEDLEIKVLPYLRIEADAEKVDGNTVVVTSKLTKTKPEDGEIVKRAVMANETPYVDFQNYINDNPIIEVDETADEELMNTTFTDTITDLSGKKVFVRVGAMVDEAGGDTYNYSKVVPVNLD